MVRNMANVGQEKGNKKTDGVSDFDGSQTLDSSRFVDVWSKQATRSAYYWAGYGVGNAESNVGRFYANLTDSAALAIDGGEFRFVVYQDSDRDYIKAVGPTFGVSEAVDSASAALRDQLMLPMLNPGAREDQYIALQLKCDADNDGNTIDTTTGSAKVQYSEVRQ